MSPLLLGAGREELHDSRSSRPRPTMSAPRCSAGGSTASPPRGALPWPWRLRVVKMGDYARRSTYDLEAGGHLPMPELVWAALNRIMKLG